MELDIVLFFVGIVILYFGAEYLVKGAANTAAHLGVTPAIVGLTVVAFGTSLPELTASLLAALKDSPDIALGNVVGSNIANVGLVLAIGALIFPMTVQRRTAVEELPVMLLFTGGVMGLAFGGELTRADGALLATALIGYTAYLVWITSQGKKRSEADNAAEEVAELLEEGNSLAYELGLTAGGIVGVVAGAYLMVESAVTIARNLGVSELVIGVTVVAVGTSLPELATTAIAAIRRHSDIAVGAVIGSNIFNIGMILGVTAMIHPLGIAYEVLTGEMLVMVGFSVALIPMAFNRRITRTSGALLLAAYAAFIAQTAMG
jgi:cation:H+ antiporter